MTMPSTTAAEPTKPELRPGKGKLRLSQGDGIGDQQTKPPGERKLTADFLRGDPAAVETVSLWIGQAAGCHRHRLLSEWDDLLQDLLLEVTAALRDGEFRGESRLRTYVSRIVHYRCLNRIRDLARRPRNERTEQAHDVPDPSRPVLERMLERESEDLLLRFLESVPADCRRLWKLILAGRSYREISRETGFSEGASRVRVLRCRKKALALWKTWLQSEHGGRPETEKVG